MVESAEKATQKEREAALREVISSMLDNPIGAIKKNSVRDEIESDRIFAKIHNKGANIARERIRQAFEKVYGRRPGIGEVRPDLARRTWIHDSDGKNNAEGWAMLAATAYDTLGAFDEIIDTLKDYSDANTLHAQYTQAKSDLNSMYIEASAVVAELASLDPMDSNPCIKINMKSYRRRLLNLMNFMTRMIVAAKAWACIVER